MRTSLARSLGRGSLLVALSALALAGCAPTDDTSVATSTSPVTVDASPATRSRSDIARWTVSLRGATLLVDGLDARGVARERDEVAVIDGRPDALSRQWFDANGRPLGAVTVTPGEGLTGAAPSGVCLTCFADTQDAAARLLSPAGEPGSTAAQALTGYAPTLADEPLVYTPSGGVTAGGGGQARSVSITRNECGACGGRLVTVCDYSAFGYCLWSHTECRADTSAAADCLRMLGGLSAY